MAFYSPDAAMDQRLGSLLQWLQAEAAEERFAAVSCTWLRYPCSLLDSSPAAVVQAAVRPGAAPAPVTAEGRGASWQGARGRDPGALVGLAYLLAAERWLQRGLLEEEPELRRALESMVVSASPEATAYVVDRLSGTTGGPSLAPHALVAWQRQRLLVNGWLASLGWSELEGCRATQKLWHEGPYGRERDWLGASQDNGNRFSSEGLARLLEAVLAGALLPPPASLRVQRLLSMPPLSHGLSGLLPPALSASLRLWGMAARQSQALQLALYAEQEGSDPVLLVLLAEGKGCGAAGDRLALLLRSLLPGGA